MEFRTRHLQERLTSGVRRRWRYWTGATRPSEDLLLARAVDTLHNMAIQRDVPWPPELLAACQDILRKFGRPVAGHSICPTAAGYEDLVVVGPLAAEFVAALRCFLQSRRQEGEATFVHARARLTSLLDRLDGALAAVRDDAELAATLASFLTAALARVGAAFGGSSECPADIDADDGRLLAVLDWLGDLSAGAHVADVGCGAGRYLRAAAGRFPSVKWLGVDPAAEALDRLPIGVERRRGGMLNLPIEDAQLDAAMAIESLEHSLLPRTAVGELCRVVRPRGSILIIDKHRRAQPLSECEPWERWFLPQEVSAWLAPFCESVECRLTNHGPGGSRSGLFLAWRGTRRSN